MNQWSFNRRQFIKTSAATAAVSSMASLRSMAASGAEKSQSSRERPRFAAIGVGDEGRAITSVNGAEWWRGKGACAFADLVAVCDVDRHRAEAFQAAYGGKAAIYEDYRRAHDRKDVEAVVIATPDHWHAAIAIAAMRAGKDVYCEKMNVPLTFAIDFVYPNGVPVHYQSDMQENGILFEGDRGRIFVNRGKITGKPVEELAEHPLPDDAIRVEKSDNHMENFFACVKSRKKPIAGVVAGHRTATALHLANISIRLGRKLAWDPVKELIPGDDEANGWLDRPRRKGYPLSQPL